MGLISEVSILKREEEFKWDLMVCRKASSPSDRRKHKGRRGVPDGTHCI
ncbi:MAG: hypothetical protein H6Q44_333 [Deltaproteobacteria bacterium]|nr:hypothetical protein [Deltaproteobacteria bacterium]